MKILFLAKSYNDLDTAASLLTLYSGDPAFEVTVLNVHQRGNPAKYNSLEYDLCEFFKRRNVQFRFPDDFSQKNFLQRLRTILTLYIPSSKKVTNSALKEFINKVLIKTKLILLPKLDYKNCARSAIHYIQPAVLLVNESALNDESDEFSRTLWQEAHKQNIDIHGIYIGQNVMLGYQPFNKKSTPHESVEKNLFIPSAMDRDYALMNGVRPDTAVISGSLRFHKQWSDQLLVLLKEYKARDYERLSKQGQGKTKIVLMLSKLRYGIAEESVLDIIETLKSIENIYLIVKPHTRLMSDDVLRKIFIPRHLGRLDFDTPSTLLIDWADACLIYVSSIGTQALHMNKLLGYIQYQSRYESTYSKHNACWTIHDLQDLKNNLKTYIAQKPYTDRDVNNYFRESIYNNREPYNVAEYVADMIGLSKQTKP